MYSPLPGLISDGDNTYLGIGAFFMGQTARLQMKQGILMVDAFYYPKIKNFTGDFIAELPVGTGMLDLYIGRGNALSGLLAYDQDLFNMTNIGIAGYTLPIISRGDMKSTHTLSALFYAGGIMNQQSNKAFAVNDDIPFTKSLSFHTGLDYSKYANERRDNFTEFSLVNLLLGHFDVDTKKLYAGYEGELTFKTGNNSSVQEISTVIRYTDFPSATIPFLSRAHFPGQYETCEFPGKILWNYSYIFPGIIQGMADGNIKVQGLMSFGKNSDGTTPSQSLPMNFKIEKKLALDFELDFPVSIGQKLTGGLSLLFDLNDINKNSKPDFSFYIACKMNWLRF